MDANIAMLEKEHEEITKVQAGGALCASRDALKEVEAEMRRVKGRTGAGTGMKYAVVVLKVFANASKKGHASRRKTKTGQKLNSANEYQPFTRNPPPQVKNVQRVLLGKYEVETWYFSPYPDDYSKLDKVCNCCVDRCLFLSCLLLYRSFRRSRSLMSAVSSHVPCPSVQYRQQSCSCSLCCRVSGLPLCTCVPCPTADPLPRASPLLSLYGLAGLGMDRPCWTCCLFLRSCSCASSASSTCERSRRSTGTDKNVP